MTEDSKPLTTFTVGPLGFNEYVQMPFGLTNTPATFQCLMETCLGEMHLKWCIIYLDDIIVFSKTPECNIRYKSWTQNDLLETSSLSVSIRAWCHIVPLDQYLRSPGNLILLCKSSSTPGSAEASRRKIEVPPI